MKTSHKIYLQGDMALRFGESFTFTGDRVQDALRCVYANRPDFKEYLIECHEKGYNFVIDTQDTDIDTPEEYFLPVLKGDVIISAIPAGSGSGFGKILAAAAIFALIFVPIPGLGQSLAGAASAPGSSFLLRAGVYIGTGIATNLAMSGLAEMMAPDPSVDQEDEGYLFNGSERNIAEGLPIPLLYGELRVPGYPVSFELLQSNRVLEQSQSVPSAEGNIVLQNTLSFNNDFTQDSEGDKEAVALAEYESASAEESARLAKDQTAVFTDIISEGPIYGLVDGGSSVFLNGDSMQTNEQSTIRLSETGVNFTLTNGSSSVTINKNSYTKDIALDTNGTKYLIVRSFDSSTSATAVEWTGTGDSRGVKVTTTSSFWVDAYLYDDTNFKSVATVRLVDSNNQTVFEGYLDSKDSGTVGYCRPIVGSDISPLYSDGTYTVIVDGKLEISSIAADQSTFTLASNFTGTTGNFQCDLGSGTYSSHSLIDNVNLYSKYTNTALQFRTGTLGQETFLDAAGTGVNNTAIGPGGSFSATAISKFQDGSGSPTAEFEGTSASGFGLTAAQAEEVDEVRVFFNYPQLWNRHLQKGKQTKATVLYTTQIAIKRNATDGYGSYITLPETRHFAASNSPITFEEIFDLKQYAPFIDFKVKFTRTTNEDQAYNSWTTSGTPSVGERYGTASAGSISSLSSIIKENLRYPLTAMAKVQAKASDFNNQLPKRTYHCKGLKVLVPSNYVTRDENDGKEAKYTRNVSTGAIESTYQDWDGNFRAEKVYTNNPAWIFYDILTNNRYGLGNWLSGSEIDKFALYRIARYCDEMVNDGNASTEARYTTNTYLTKATDAFKVVKDLATVFNGMLYWLDGEVFPVIDQPANPVYNFAKSNVINGAFSYESTGSKTRANQIVVKWNDPDNDYKLSNLVLEDRDNIVKTGKIISKDVVAFGCTSEGQAIRYGRWKLWTSVNQTELVSFKTSINANFLAPGDIINVQDADRYPGHTIYSGRVSNTGTRNTTTVPLDRSIELVSGSIYKLSVLVEEPATFLAQDSATIDGVAYAEGDLILTDADSSAITTESVASNLVDDSGNPVLTAWKPYTRVEEQTVSTSAGTGISSLTVSSAFSTAPNAETIWVIRETVSSVDTIDSKKTYKILSLSQEEDQLYAITAVEHDNQKFTSIESDTFSLKTQDPVFPTPKTTEVVPAPTNVYVHVSDLGPGELEDDAELFWDAPTQSGNATSIYPFIDGYEIEHNLPLASNPLTVGKDVRYLKGLDIPPGTYSVGVRTISQGRKSAVTKATFTIEEPAQQSVPRGFGMPLGGVSNSAPYITSAGTFYLENSNFVFSPIGDPQFVKEFDGSPASEYSQDCSNISSVNYSALSTEFDRQLASHYIMFDADAADPLTLIKFYQDNDLGYGYFYDAGTGNTTHTSNWTTLTGTVSVAANSNKVVGSSTSFSSELAVGDIIKFSSTQAAKVVFVASDTDVRIDKSFTTAIAAGTTAYENTFKFDRNRDAVFAQIRNDSGTFRYYPVNLVVNKDLDSEARVLTFTAAPSVILFDGSSTLTTSYTNLVLTAVAEGWVQPQFKITGAGFTNSDISQSAESSFSDATSGKTYTKTLDKVTTYSATALEFTVTVRDKLDTGNTNKQRSVNLTIPMVKDGADGADGVDGADGADGAAGADGRVVSLTTDAQVFVYNSSGTSPSPSSATITAAALNTSGTVYYEFFLNDSSVQNSTTATYSYTPQTNESSMPDKIEVQIREGSSSSTVLARDQITMSGVKPGTNGTDGTNGTNGADGVDGLTVSLSNASHSVPVTNTGTVTYTGSGTTVKLYEGATELTYDGVGTSNGTWKITTTGSSITSGSTTDSGSYATIGDHSNMTADIAFVSIAITGKRSNGSSITLTILQSLSKSIQGNDGTDGADGVDGADGADGSAGAGARAVNLTAADQVFTYSAAGSSPSPSSTTVTATALNTSGTVYYQFFLNDSSVQNTTSSTYSYSPQASHSNMPDKIEVQIREGSSTSTVLARDQITMSGVKPGNDGVDGLTVIISNEAHTLPTTNTGTVTYTGSGTTVRVYEGSTELVYGGLGVNAGTWVLSTNASSITAGSVTDSGDYATIGNHNNMTADNASVTINITGQRQDGTSFSISKFQTLSKSKQGDNGATGATGATGADGDDGLRTAEGYVYYNTATSSAPSGPDDGSVYYYWSNGSIIGMRSGWQQSPPEMGAGASGKYYYSRYRVTQSSSTSVVETTNLVFGSVTLGHNFTGLVTFSSGTFQEDGSNITTIDGGNITTGTVSLDAIDTNTTLADNTGAHSFSFATTGISISGTDYDTTAKFISDHDANCTALFCQYTGNDPDSFSLASITDAGSAGAFSYGNNGAYGPSGVNFLTACSSTKLINGYNGSTNSFYVLNDGDLWCKGLLSKQGSSATSPGANRFNFYWASTAAQVWVDTTNIGTITVSSDYRIKQNITTQTATAVDRIEQLRPVTYMFADNPSFSWISDGVTREGFIAHEVAEVIPSAVEGAKDAENQLQSLNLDAICAVLVKAVQEQQATIEALEARIEALETT